MPKMGTKLPRIRTPKSKELRVQMQVKLILLFLAGGIGTLARYGLSSMVQRISASEMPYGTFAVNGIGCFLFGLVWPLAEQRLLISGETRFIILTGFMGAFTTFSTFAFESSGLLRDSQWWQAAANILAQNVVGISAVILGMATAKLF